MSNGSIHFEVFIRRTANDDWTLQFATEDRQAAVDLAENLLTEKKAAAVRVSRETLNEDTREFVSHTVLSKGLTQTVKPKRRNAESDRPVCTEPADLYTLHARETIARLLQTWLARNGVTTLEVMHRSDLLEQLEASGVDLQHAIQKIALAESQARDMSVHEAMRWFQSLVDRAIARVSRDCRTGVFPTATPASFAKIVEQLQDHPDCTYLLNGAIARSLSTHTTWPQKLGHLLDLVDATPVDGKTGLTANTVLEGYLREMLDSAAALNAVLGPQTDLGAHMGALVRLASADVVSALSRADPQLSTLVPQLEGAAARLSSKFKGNALIGVRRAILKGVIQDLGGPRRLRPNDPSGEIAILRALVTNLSAMPAHLIDIGDLEKAVTERSRHLVTGNFVTGYIADSGSALIDAQALIRLADNITGAANKCEAARWILTTLGGLKFERELRESAVSPTSKLAILADLQRSLRRAGLAPSDSEACITKIGEIGALVESDSRLMQTVQRSAASPVQRLMILLQMAAGETAPQGPCADRARNEAIRLLRSSEIRPALAAAPDQLGRVRQLMGAIGLAA